MPPKSKGKEAIILVIDCGKSMSEKCRDSDETVFQVSKQCLENIIRQKLFSETKNEYLLVEYSTNTAVGVKINGRLRSPNFDLLRYITTRLDVSDNHNNTSVVDALNVSISQMIRELDEYTGMKLALFTNFHHFTQTDFQRFKSEVIPKLVKTEIQLLIFSELIPDSCYSVFSIHLSESQKLGLQLMKLIEESSLGFYYDLKKSVHNFSEFEAKKVNPNAWYSNLELGIGLNAINIPIAAYSKVMPFQRKKGDISLIKTSDNTDNTSDYFSNNLNQSQTQSVTPLIRTTLSTDNKSDNISNPIDSDPNLTQTSSSSVNPTTSLSFISETDNQIEVKEEVIRGYYYGQTFVPFSEEDKKMFEYNKREKGFKIIGFTSFQNIDISQRIGEKTNYVFSDPRLKQNNHKLVFQALVAAMIDQNKVAIVRYNYQNSSAPQIGCLIPFIEENRLLLSYIQLPFAEDVRKFNLPSLWSKSSYCPTETQLKAIDDLIDAMDLMTAGVDDDDNQCEALKSDQIRDPLVQHWFSSLYYKHLNNLKSDLPQISSEHKNLIETPTELSEKSAKPLTQILENFSLKSEISIKKKSAAKQSSSRLTTDSQSPKRQRIDIELNENINISDIMSDINNLMASETPFEEISKRFGLYFKLMFENINKYEENAEQIVDLIRVFRQKCVDNKDPNPFNDLMCDKINSIRGTNVWYSLLSQEVKPIGQSECPNSRESQESVDNRVNEIIEIK